MVVIFISIYVPQASEFRIISSLFMCVSSTHSKSFPIYNSEENYL